MKITENLKKEILIFLENNKYSLLERGITLTEIEDYVHELRGNYWCRYCGHDFCEC